jgi:hypothetical protein
LVLSFLSILGGALLAATTLDVWIGDNYRTAVQLIHSAESGIEEARVLLQSGSASPTALLEVSAGADGVLATGDDVPLADRKGEYVVLLRNDAADGPANRTDTNRVVTLLSTSTKGKSQKTIEVTVAKAGFPRLTKAIALGVFESGMDRRLQTPHQLERIVDGILANATDRYDAGLGVTTFLGYVGAPNDYRAVVVNGDCVLGPGEGFGLLLVRGTLEMRGTFRWNGLILVIGQGSIRWPAGADGYVSGAIFSARTRADDRSSTNSLGSMLASMGSVTSDFSGTGTVDLNPMEIDRAGEDMPYIPIAYREY